MKLSAKAEYGVRMMVELAMAHGNGPVALSSIAEKQGISMDFLEQLVATLRKQGVVESVRGARGGYQLARSPESITVGEILVAIEGPFVPMICLEVDHAGQPDCCARLAFCTTREVWVRLQDQVNSTLSSISLADLAHPNPDHPVYLVVPHDGAKPEAQDALRPVPMAGHSEPEDVSHAHR